jgi:hypothetical protein
MDLCLNDLTSGRKVAFSNRSSARLGGKQRGEPAGLRDETEHIGGHSLPLWLRLADWFEVSIAQCGDRGTADAHMSCPLAERVVELTKDVCCIRIMQIV